MTVNFFTQGIELLQQGVAKDVAKEYKGALDLYIHSMEYFLTGLKCMLYVEICFCLFVFVC
jgi:hypothetical protein